MIIATDVYYWEDKAKAVGILFDDWEHENVLKINTAMLDGIADYVPGSFYKRELPCLLALLDQVDRAAVKYIIVDGYVLLNNEGKFGLGAYLYEALDGMIPIIGVAKKHFISNTQNAIAVLRGASKNPLYISSIGIDLEAAAALIKNMKGDYRMPDLLKLVDQHTRL